MVNFRIENRMNKLEKENYILNERMTILETALQKLTDFIETKVPTCENGFVFIKDPNDERTK